MSRIITIGNSHYGAQGSAGMGASCGRTNRVNALGLIGAYGKQQKNAARAADMSGGKTTQSKVKLRDIKSLLKMNDPQQDPYKAYSNTSVLSSSQSYADSLRMQRANSKNTTLNQQKLKYQFKDVSVRIIRSKTSLAAKQAVGQAQREIQRLKKAKRSGKYDSEELEAALNHAMAMERVARKKARHLEEEEMAAAAGGRGLTMIEDEEDLRNDAVEADEMSEGENAEGEMSGEEAAQAAEAEQIVQTEDYSSDSESMSYVMTAMQELADEMAEEVNDSLQEMLEEMGLDGLTEDIKAATGRMEVQDIENMRINHRNKEMKDIAKADGEYLKAIFEHLQKLMDGSSTPGGGAMPDGAGTGEASANIGAMAAPAAAVAAMPMIDVAL